MSGCDIILGNEEDAEKVFGIKPEGFQAEHTGGEVDAAEFESVCRQLMRRFREPKVIITLRGSINANHNTWGGCLYSDKLYQSRRYDITYRGQGWRGDSFMEVDYGLITYPQDDQRALICSSRILSETHHLRRFQPGNGQGGGEPDEG